MARNQKIAGRETAAGGPLWRNRNFMLLWSGQTISAMGSRVSQIAFPLLVLALTPSAALAGVVGGIRILPFILLSLPAGALVDRWNRKRLMIICDTGRALALGAIPLAIILGRLSVPLILAATLVEGTCYVFFSLAELASIPRVVRGEQLSTALALNEVGTDVAEVAGPALGGMLFGLARALPFVADALSYVVSVLSLLGIRSQFQQERTEPRQPLWQAIRAGIAWLLRHRLVRLLAILTAAANMAEFSFMLLIVVVTTRSHLGSSTTGLILAAGSLSGLIVAPLTPLLQKRIAFGRLIISMQWLYALTLPFFALAQSPLALALVTGVFFGIGTVLALMQYTYRLSVIPDEMQGRVNSVYRLLVLTGQGIGPVLTGLLLQLWNPEGVIAVFTILLIALAGVASVSTAIRHADSNSLKAAQPEQLQSVD